MSSRRWAGFVVALLAVAGVAAAALLSQRQEAALLRAELELARLEAADQARLAAENDRLRAQQVSPAALERLRADHAAVVRLRAELEALRKK